jgi:hypothetical protein
VCCNTDPTKVLSDKREVIVNKYYKLSMISNRENEFRKKDDVMLIAIISLVIYRNLTIF